MLRDRSCLTHYTGEQITYTGCKCSQIIKLTNKAILDKGGIQKYITYLSFNNPILRCIARIIFCHTLSSV